MTAFLFSTHVWHSSTILLPETPVLVQGGVTLPCPQPVVRPTLLTGPLVAAPSPLLVNVPTTSSEPVFGAAVLAMVPSAKVPLPAPATKFESELRQTRPLGQPLPLRTYGRSTVSVPINSPST